jgi:hypothetical protein
VCVCVCVCVACTAGGDADLFRWWCLQTDQCGMCAAGGDNLFMLAVTWRRDSDKSTI